MKKLILILSMFLMCCSITAQEYVENSKAEKGVLIDTRLEKYLVEYIVEAKERGLDVLPRVISMDYIGFSKNIKYPILGRAYQNEKSVYIAEFCKLDKIILKVVFFHEMTHYIFNAKHSKCSEYDIMSEIAPKSFRIYEDEKFWKLRLDELFKDKIIVSK